VTLFWVPLVSFAPLILVFVLTGLFFRIRSRRDPFAVADARVVGTFDHAGWVELKFTDAVGEQRTAHVASVTRRAPGTEVRVVYDTRDPGRASLLTYWTDGSSMFAVAAGSAIVAVLFAVLILVLPEGL